MSTYEEHADDARQSSRPHSIDLTLALERELDAESLPNSPAIPSGRPNSLDTHVLASIITQLRMNVDDLTKERDAFAKELADSKTREADMLASLSTVTEKCARLETELVAAQEQVKQDEESISMLRSKVEESRRGLMALQSDRRKTLDLSRAGQPMLGAPMSSKRASFTPLTGTSAGRTGHRRIVSVSDYGMASPTLSDASWAQTPHSPNESYTSPPQTKAARRASGFFGFSTPVPDAPVFVQVDASEMDALHKELAQVKDQLEEAQHELNDTLEAKSLSDDCVRSLRAFIAENSIGEPAGRAATGARTVPPTPANTPQSMNKSGNVSRWGFKLWNTAAVSPAASPASSASQNVQESPLRKKLPPVPNARASISSVSSLMPPMQHMPSLAGSETSSVADSSVEPISPVSELPPLPRMSIALDDGSALAFSPSESAESMKTAASTESTATALA